MSSKRRHQTKLLERSDGGLSIAETRNGGSGSPRDAVLFELPGWDACMTWRLDDGRTVLQNFVMREEDCTPSEGF